MRLIFVLLVFVSSQALSQNLPRSVDIPIQNIQQGTEVWCWAAVAQQIIYSLNGPGGTPAQCALVAMANGAPPQACCTGYNPQCLRTGSIPQIQGLIRQFGGRYSSYAPPADPMTLYRTLSSGKPIILQIQTGMNSAHVVVLRGMHFAQGRYGVEAMLHINDPLSYFTQPVSFGRIAPIWMSAIVVN